LGKRATPAPPDPVATAQAQGAMNAETARVQAALNRGDTITPFGNITNRALGNDRWETRVDLSPEQLAILRQGEQLDLRTGQLALDAIPRAQRILSSDVDTAAMQPWMLDDADARNRATAGILSRLEPQFERDRESLEGRLLAQGFVPGSEGYNRAADELARARTDARLQADAAGLTESQRAAQMANALRQAQFGEQLQLRAQPINEISALFGLGPGMQMPQAANLAQVGVAPPDYQGAVANNYQQQVAAVNARNQASAGLLGSVFGLGGSALGALRWSDRRLKRNIVRIGTAGNGLPIYRWIYLWGAPGVGFMADEVARVRPEAVAFGPDGYAMVNYALAAA